MPENAPSGDEQIRSRPRVATARLDFDIEVERPAWTDETSADLVETEATDLLPPAVKAVPIRIKAQAISVTGFQFPDSPWHGVAAPASSTKAKKKKTQTPRQEQQTRFKPPSDVIKLEDRLFYVLQPPLENIVANNEIHFPFEPFPYQYEGVAFLYPRYTAILADEMGLGKTMQAATTMRLLLMTGEMRRILLVCPKPLVTNWKRELGLWAPEIPVTIIEGDQQKRAYQWSQDRTPITLANYELLMRDRDIVNDEAQHFDLVVLDEAQRIKNRSSTTSQVVCSIPRTRSWALTGTPVENSPEDLVGIFEFLSPGYLNSGMQARRMGKLVQDHILRRTKDMVLTDMPPKMFRDANIQLTAEQWESYRIAEDEGVVRLSEMGDELTIQHVFQLVLRLKQICNFDPVTGASSKLERLEADLEEVAASGQKAIVFSQWVQSLEKLRDALKRFRPLEYHGKVPASRRDGVIEQFRNDPKSHVILMSYGAGSVGLNLQFSEYVFLFDRWWNPAVEDQAINRAHRIGVAGPVTVTRMLSVDTIEERIHQVLEEKRELFETILSHTGDPRKTGLTQSEIFGLFKLKPKPKTKASTPQGEAKAA